MKNIYTFETNGKTTKVFLPKFEIDMGTMKQLKAMTSNPVIHNARVMPDCHKSVGCCVGMTSQIKDKVIPSIVGGDIGCGISCYPLNKKIKDNPYEFYEKVFEDEEELQKYEMFLRQNKLDSESFKGFNNKELP